MDFHFSIAWVLGGIALIVIGVALIRFYKIIADNLLSGVGSYAHIKLAALITIGTGVAAMTNLIPLLLSLLATVLVQGSGR